jgi:hypothetical protein
MTTFSPARLHQPDEDKRVHPRFLPSPMAPSSVRRAPKRGIRTSRHKSFDSHHPIGGSLRKPLSKPSTRPRGRGRLLNPRRFSKTRYPLRQTRMPDPMLPTPHTREIRARPFDRSVEVLPRILVQHSLPESRTQVRLRLPPTRSAGTRCALQALPDCWRSEAPFLVRPMPRPGLENPTTDSSFPHTRASGLASLSLQPLFDLRSDIGP